MRGRAEIICEDFVQPNSVDAVYINFPEPIKKPRNHLLQVPLAVRIGQILKPGASLHYLTDHEKLFKYSCEVMTNNQVQNLLLKKMDP